MTRLFGKSHLIAMAAVTIFLTHVSLSSRMVPPNGATVSPFALPNSGLGRSLGRWLTDEADSAYHHGAGNEKASTSKPAPGQEAEDAPPDPRGMTPVSRALDGLNARLSPHEAARTGRAHFGPADVKSALRRTEFWYRTAFELDPGNYRAYDAYLFFLTHRIQSTEFGRVPGGLYSPAEMAEREAHALEISRLALRSYRLNGVDVEQYLGAALTWFNIGELTLPGPDLRRGNPTMSRDFIGKATPIVEAMQQLLADAERARQHDIDSGIYAQLSAERHEDITQSLHFIRELSKGTATVLQREKDRLSAPTPVPDQ